MQLNIPSWELTYPLKSPFWRWFSFSPGGMCEISWRVPVPWESYWVTELFAKSSWPKFLPALATRPGWTFLHDLCEDWGRLGTVSLFIIFDRGKTGGKKKTKNAFSRETSESSSWSWFYPPFVLFEKRDHVSGNVANSMCPALFGCYPPYATKIALWKLMVGRRSGFLLGLTAFFSGAMPDCWFQGGYSNCCAPACNPRTRPKNLAPMNIYAMSGSPCTCPLRPML